MDNASCQRVVFCVCYVHLIYSTRAFNTLVLGPRLRGDKRRTSSVVVVIQFQHAEMRKDEPLKKESLKRIVVALRFVLLAGHGAAMSPTVLVPHRTALVRRSRMLSGRPERLEDFFTSDAQCGPPELAA